MVFLLESLILRKQVSKLKPNSKYSGNMSMTMAFIPNPNRFWKHEMIHFKFVILKRKWRKRKKEKGKKPIKIDRYVGLLGRALNRWKRQLERIIKEFIDEFLTPCQGDIIKWLATD